MRPLLYMRASYRGGGLLYRLMHRSSRHAGLWQVGRSEGQGACMEYAVLMEQKQGGWRAFIPALADLGAEGRSRDEAVRNVQRAAEAYLASVEVTTIKVNLPQELSRRPGSPQTLLRALEAFAGDEEALREHFEEIARERQRQRAEAQQQDVE